MRHEQSPLRSSAFRSRTRLQVRHQRATLYVISDSAAFESRNESRQKIWSHIKASVSIRYVPSMRAPIATNPFRLLDVIEAPGTSAPFGRSATASATSSATAQRKSLHLPGGRPTRRSGVHRPRRNHAKSEDNGCPRGLSSAIIVGAACRHSFETSAKARSTQRGTSDEFAWVAIARLVLMGSAHVARSRIGGTFANDRSDADALGHWNT